MLRVEGGMLVEITTFEPRLFALFGLPSTISPTDLKSDRSGR
jgi:hypothetical protein